jgi:hypothetical protein
MRRKIKDFFTPMSPQRRRSSAHSLNIINQAEKYRTVAGYCTGTLRKVRFTRTFRYSRTDVTDVSADSNEDLNIKESNF